MDPVSIQLIDPEQNILAQWLNEQPKMGVVAKEFHLTDAPITGDWVIDVKSLGGLEAKKIITVDRYLLPKFEVIIEQPSFISDDQSASVTVRAR